MTFGYARISTKEQNVDLQYNALLKYGIKENNIVKDVVSGASSKRIKLDELIKQLRSGDTLVVWKLDRIARSLIHFSKVMHDLNERNIRFKSLTEPFIDTTERSAQSKFIINMFAVLAELERDIIIERTKAGLDSARLRGKIIGRPEGISEESNKKADLCAYYFKEGILSVDDICKRVGVSRGTYYKYLDIKGLKGKTRKYKKV